MSELLSSVLALTLIFALGVPLATFLAKGVLVIRWRRGSEVRRHGSLPSFLLIVGPSLITVLWFVSAAVHRSEPGEGFGVCAFDHAGLEASADSLILALLLATVLATVVAATLTHRWRPVCRGAQRMIAATYFERLSRICRGHAVLRRVSARVRPSAAKAHPICVRGLIRPTVEVSTALMDRLDDTALEAALLHEASHVEGRDPLRYLLASAALALNPLGFLLRPDLRRWRACREAVCDHDAVGRSADAFSLAEAIVAASRLTRSPQPLAVGLGESSAGLVSLRVHLLMDYASKPQRPARPSSRWRGIWIVAAIILSPHVLGVWPLDDLHGAAETLLATAGLI